MTFDGKTVLITGAGKGIGRETARMLASRGAHIVALSRTQADLESLEDEIGSTSIVADLEDAEAARAAAKTALPADYLVNCAGINILQPFLDVTVEAFDKIQAVNVRAAMILAQEYARVRIAAAVGVQSSTYRAFRRSSASTNTPHIAHRKELWTL